MLVVIIVVIVAAAADDDVLVCFSFKSLSSVKRITPGHVAPSLPFPVGRGTRRRIPG